jgi:hypothetical protein
MPIDNPYQHGHEKYSYTPIVYQLQKQYKNYLSNGSSPATRSVSRCCQGSSSTLIMLKYNLIKWFLADALYYYEDR